MTTDTQHVVVLLGIPLEPDQEMVPATVFDLPASKYIRYQHIHRNQAKMMGGADHAKWTAVYLNGQWTLKEMVPW